MERRNIKAIEYEPLDKPLLKAPAVIGEDVRNNNNSSNNNIIQRLNRYEEIKEKEDFERRQLRKLRGAPNLAQPMVVNANTIDKDRDCHIQTENNSVAALVEGEDLIANDNEIQEIKYLVTCAICQELATLSHEPKFCLKCQMAVFCKSCIEGWLKQPGKTCPMCRDGKPQMQAVSENKVLMALIKTVKLHCKFKNRGCPEIVTFDQYENHAKECGVCKLCEEVVYYNDKPEHYSDHCLKYTVKCTFCSFEAPRKDMQSHRCYKMYLGTKKNGQDYYFDKSRIANMNEIKTYYDQLKCAVCSNLMRQAKQCANLKCQSNICQKCLSEHTKKKKECPICKTKDAQFTKVMRQLKNLLNKVRVRCYNCMQDFGYQQIDEHELTCGKCNLCSIKLTEAIKIPNHHITDCPKYKISCIQCQQTFKRPEFRTHKCENLSPDELTNKVLKREQEKIVKKQQIIDSGQVTGGGEAVEETDYEKHWRKKTAGRYRLGIRRWFKVCKENYKRDYDTSTKLFQIIFMIVFAIIEITISSIAWGRILTLKNSDVVIFWIFIGGIIVEFGWQLLSAVYTYSLLGVHWEGYRDHKKLQFMHVITMIFVSLLPHGDLLLHMGYRQNGYKVKGIKEPFPHGFKILTQPQNYQGYLSNNYKGGFYTFLIMGCQRFILQLIRIIAWMVGLNFHGEFFQLIKWAQLVMIFLVGNALISISMLVKIYFENNEVKWFEPRVKQKKQRFSLISNDEII